ncbi:MAG: DUF4019 domain-containing protein [Chlamydiales bacterium]|nr:DUF4019 domain-containing protein [Chlamydiales bacterium]
MKKSLLIAFCAIFSCLSAADPAPVKTTTEVKQPEAKRVCCDALDPNAAIDRAAKAWLNLVDIGDYRQSWAAGSELIRCRWDACKWNNSLNRNRYCLGKVTSRELTCMQYTCKMKKMPEGQYVILTYNTCFECSGSRCERVILRCDRDCGCGSRWRVAYYSLR